ncbi:MAG: hypothetical protein GY757_33905, partial [bacterium]|nr:hypothetical protein [bacterium]
MENITDFDHIVKYFLEIFRLQLGAAGQKNKPPYYKLLPARGSSSEKTYELYVTHEDRVRTRRMTICRLGEAVQSKSTCYMLVYGDILVVKIPPTPVTDFDEYLESINVERRISQSLEPEIPCLSPNVSAILKKIPAFGDNEGKDPVKLENKFIS